MLQFFVAGIPKSMSVGKTVRVPNVRGGGVTQFQTRGHTDWAVLVGHIGRQHAPPVPLTGPVAVTAVFCLPKPATARKRDVLPIKRPDLDNLIHKLTDQFNGIFWADDSQIVELVVRKRFAENGRPGLLLTVASVRESC